MIFRLCVWMRGGGVAIALHFQEFRNTSLPLIYILMLSDIIKQSLIHYLLMKSGVKENKPPFREDLIKEQP